MLIINLVTFGSSLLVLVKSGAVGKVFILKMPVWFPGHTTPNLICQGLLHTPRITRLVNVKKVYTCCICNADHHYNGSRPFASLFFLRLASDKKCSDGHFFKIVEFTR